MGRWPRIRQLKIRVKNQADFEIVNTTGSVYAGKDNIIEVAIKNTGEEEARNVKAIINPSDPLSTTDSAAFLSTIEPGSTAVAKIKIKADSEAVPKLYQGVEHSIEIKNPEECAFVNCLIISRLQVNWQGSRTV